MRARRPNQDLKLLFLEKLLLIQKRGASEEEAQVERVMPDTDGDTDQRLDQPTA